MAAFPAVPGTERVDHREAAVALGIAQPVETGLAALPSESGVLHRLRERLFEPAALHEERVVVPGDAHRFRHGSEDRLGPGYFARLVERQPREGLLLVGTE